MGAISDFARLERLRRLDSDFDNTHSLRDWLRIWLPVVLWIGVIALESTALFGADKTSGPLRWLYQSVFGPVSNGQWDVIHHYIRKTGHFLGYGMIGLAWLRAWWMTLPRSPFIVNAILAVFGTGLVASADELHQSFLPNRTGLPSDVLLDCCGAIVLQLAVYIVIRAFRSDLLAKAA